MTGIIQKKALRLDVTRALVLINIAVFLFMVASTANWRSVLLPAPDLLLRWGANLGALTVDGQYWRLFTSMFIHAGILHLGLNMYALWVFGPSLEKTFGWRSFLAVYFISGLAGALASTVWNPAQISAGASGALVGSAGAMLAALIRGEPDEAKASGFGQPLIFFGVICASLLYGFFIPSIDNAAHIGGLVGGFLCGFALLPAKQPRSKVTQAVTAAIICITAIAVTSLCLVQAKADKRSTTYKIAVAAMADLKANRYEDAYRAYDELLKYELNSSYFVGRATALIGLKQYDRAVADCAKAIAVNPKDPTPVLARARARHEQGNDIEAIEDLTTVIIAYPRNASAFNSRSWSEIALGRYRQALTDVEMSLELEPDRPDALDTRGVVRYCLHDFDRALGDFGRAIADDPQQGAAYFHRAMIYEQTGRKDEAAKDREKAKQLEYKPEAWELRLQERK